MCTLTHWVPERHLPLAHAAEARAEYLVVGHEQGPDRPGALMGLFLLLRVEGEGDGFKAMLTSRTISTA